MYTIPEFDLVSKEEAIQHHQHISTMNRQFLVMSMCAGLLMLLAACQKDGNNPNFQLYMTDAPFDDARVEAVFITVTEIQVDGETMTGFTPKTFELSAYQKGEVFLLGETDLTSGAHQSITLTLDYAQDASGNMPGCYLTTVDGSTHLLSSTSTQIQLPANFTTNSSDTEAMVIDFDLRKCIQPQSNGADQYDFVAKADLQNRIRVVKKSECGTIKGKLTNQISNSDKVIVYAYDKGTYNALLESQTQNQIGFLNAEASAAVSADGTYTLSFLPQGEYECVFIAMKDLNNDGRMDIQGTFSLQVAGGLNTKAIQVNTSSTTTLDVTATGLLPF